MKKVFSYAAAVAALVFGAPHAVMAQAPSLIGTPSSISAAYTIGAINAPAPVEIPTLSTGTQFLVTGTINFTGTGGWAYLAPPSTQTASSQKITVVFSPGGVPGGLAVGTYTANIVLTGGATPVSIPLTLNVVSVAQLAVSPNPISISAAPGTNPGTAIVNVSSTGSPFNYQVAASTTTGGNWLSVSPGAATTGTAIMLTANPTGLAAGNYTGKITLTAAGVPNSPLDIPVTLTIAAPTPISVSPAALNFSFQTGTPAPAAQGLTVGNNGIAFTAAISYVSATTGWLTVTPLTGTGPATVQVSVNPAGLTNGTYTAKVNISAPGNLAAVDVPVTLVVSNLPLLNPNPSGLTFNSQPGSVPPTQSITFSTSSTPLSYTVTNPTPASWLVYSPAIGDTTSNNKLFVSANPIGLAAGTYNTSLTVTSAAAGNSPLTIPVTLNVQAAITLNVTPSTLAFTAPVAGAIPAFQALAVTGPDATPQPFTVKATTTDGGSWLVLDRSSGVTTAAAPAAMVNVGVNQAGLAPGNYSGSIIFTATASNTTQTIPVTLTVTGSASLTVTPATLSFTQPTGGPAPAPQNLQVSSSTSGINFIAQASSATNWLSISPTAGTTTAGTPVSLTVSINAATLAAGTYNGSITILPAGSGNVITVPVTLTVGTVATLSVSPATINYAYTVGGPVPAAQNINISSTGGPIPFTATASTANNGTWLGVSATSGTTPALLAVNLSPAGLAAGTYTGTIVVAAQGATNGPQTVNVTLTVSGPTPPSISTMVNGASFQPTPAVPGLIVTFTGSNLGPATGVSFKLNAQGNIDNLLSDTRVLFDGNPAPVLYTSAGQVNAIVPYFLFGRLSTSVQVEYLGQKSNAIQLRVDQFSPGIFTLDTRGQGAILNQNNSVNGSANAADRGSIIQIFATGEGQTNPPGADGKIIGVDLRKPLQPVTVRIGGVNADVTYYGSAPGLVAGVMQVNARVPSNIAPGAQPVELQISTVVSQPGVTVSVK